ncbi:MAG: hypothetical protein IT463_02490 [Planctomycetes bacterium]|nr:hypothetical protein [Planctomycetota bacterium]
MATLAPAARNNEAHWRWRVTLGLGLVLAALHGLVLPRLCAPEYRPDLFTLFAVYLSLFSARQGRYWHLLALGLLRDLFSLGLLGSYGVLYSLLYKGIGRARGKLDPERPGNTLLFGFAGVFAVNVGYHVTLVASGDGVGWSAAFTRCLITAAVTAPWALPTFVLAHYALEKLKCPRAPGGCWAI